MEMTASRRVPVTESRPKTIAHPRWSAKGVDAVKTYMHQPLKELADQQVRFAPPPRRLEQLKRAEQLLTEIDPNRAYPYQFVSFRVNDHRSELHPGLLIPGADL